MRHAATAVLIAAATLFASTALAQDMQQPPTIFMTSWQCDTGALGALIDSTQAHDMPLYQDMVNERKLWSFSIMVHNWGDEWNFVTVLVADDANAGMAARAEFAERSKSTDTTFEEHCHTHRDNIYVGAFYTEQPDLDVKPPYSVSMSYFACPSADLDAIIAADRDVFLPAATASVTDKKGYAVGAVRHLWGDEWNYAVFRSAADVAGLTTLAADTGARIEASHPDRTPPTLACTHKDNIYRVVLETEPPPEEPMN